MGCSLARPPATPWWAWPPPPSDDSVVAGGVRPHPPSGDSVVADMARYHPSSGDGMGGLRRPQVSLLLSPADAPLLLFPTAAELLVGISPLQPSPCGRRCPRAGGWHSRVRIRCFRSTAIGLYVLVPGSEF
jgi:hypothetical protein